MRDRAIYSPGPSASSQEGIVSVRNTVVRGRRCTCRSGRGRSNSCLSDLRQKNRIQKRHHDVYYVLIAGQAAAGKLPALACSPGTACGCQWGFTSDNPVYQTLHSRRCHLRWNRSFCYQRYQAISSSTGYERQIPANLDATLGDPQCTTISQILRTRVNPSPIGTRLKFTLGSV